MFIVLFTYLDQLTGTARISTRTNAHTRTHTHAHTLTHTHTHTHTDRPPEYASVLVEEEEDGCGEHYSGAPPLSYAAVMAVERPTQPTPPAKVLTGMAPWCVFVCVCVCV